MSRPRIAVAALALSAAAFVGITSDESYSSTAIIPTRGDVPTLGFGSTTREDGSPVRMKDTTTPPKALARTLQYIQADEADMRKTLDGVALHQAEYDVYIDWRYQYGATAWRSSSMLRELRAGNYPGACQALLKYRFSAGYDCSTPGNRVCAGVWTRQLKRHAACMATQ
ncbi:lysozyme [soil metagenome]